MSRKCQCGTIYGAMGTVCFLCGLITTAFWWKLYNGVVLKHLPLSNNSEMFRLWADTHVPLYINVYLFNWTNANATVLNGEKPALQQVGPYVYKMEIYRKDFVWNDNDTLTYSTGQRFYYVPEKSPANPYEDVVTVPNMLLVGMKYKLKTDPPASRFVEYPMLLQSENVDPSKVFVKKTVSELLFDGYENSLLSTLYNIKNSMDSAKNLSLSAEALFAPLVDWTQILGPLIPLVVKNTSDSVRDFFNNPAKVVYEELEGVPKRFPGLVPVNGTRENTVNINAGNTDLKKFGLVNDCNYRREYPVRGNGSCGRIIQPYSLGDFWPVNSAKGKSASVFVPNLCSSLRLENVGTQDMDGIEGVRFESTNTTFDEDEDALNYNFLKSSGVGNLSSCLKVPMFASLPHFYAANTSFLDAVSGLTPDRNLHAFHLTLHKNYGFLMNGSIRLQMNVQLQDITLSSQWANRVVPDVVLPILWFEANIMLPTAVQDKLHFAFVIVPLVFKTVGYSLLLLGILILTGYYYRSLVHSIKSLRI